MNMTTKIKIVFVAFILIFLTIFSGCGRQDTPEEYLKTQIQKVKDGKSTLYKHILDKEIEKQKTDNFPKEVKDDYLIFLKKVYSNIRYKIIKTENKGRNRYRLTVKLQPVNLEKTVLQANEKYIANMQSADFAAETANIIELDLKELDTPVYEDEVKVSVLMDWENDKNEINEKDFSTLLDLAVSDKLAPYQMVAEVFDIQEYVRTSLDEIKKGAFLEKDPLEEYEFSEAERERFFSAERKLLALTTYEVGIPRKAGEDHYTVEVNVVPNTSLKLCSEEITARVNNGSITSIEELKNEYLTALENCVAEPQYGESVKVTLNIVPDENHLLQIPQEEYDSLIHMLLPVE